MKQAGWRTRQHAVINNCGTVTDVMMWKSVESESFHIRQTRKEMGMQGSVIFESILPFEDAYQQYTARVTDALLEVIEPPNPANVGYTIVEEDDGEVVVSNR